MADDTEEFESLSEVEKDAFSLSKAAIMLDQAKGDSKAVAAALDNNLELWITIRTVVSRPDSTMPDDVRQNLVKLSHYVADTTFKHGADAPEKVLDSLININLQIAQGLLEGQDKG